MGQKNKVRKFVESNIVTWLGVLVIATLLSTGKMAEILGEYFPVMTPLEITSIEPTTTRDLPSSLISGTSEKLRDCNQQSMRWYIVEGHQEGSVFSLFLDRPQVHGKGPMVFKGIIVGLPPEDIKYSRAEVTHNCFGGNVRIVTNFFSGSEVE